MKCRVSDCNKEATKPWKISQLIWSNSNLEMCKEHG